MTHSQIQIIDPFSLSELMPQAYWQAWNILGEHLKQLRADLEHCKSPACQEAEREYEEMNQNLLQEVSLSVPVVTEPANAAIPPNVSMPRVFTAPIVAIPSSVNIIATTKELETMGLHAEWVQGTALAKAIPGCPYSVSG